MTQSVSQGPQIAREAPPLAHAKLDRLWLIREDDGAATITTTIYDPDGRVPYALTLSLVRT